MNEFLPLSGIRICDFSAVWAGQSATMYLADMGAECIKVENPYIWNPMTRAASPRITAQTSMFLPPWIGGHPNNDPGPRPWNNCSAFIHVLRNKRSFTVDSRRPEGLAVVKALVAMSDILAENLAIGTLEKIGLDDDTVRAIRPDMIIVHLPAFGRTGAYVQGRGYGSHMDAVGGSTILRGYRETSPMTNIQVFAGDFTAGMHGAVATLAALRHRRRTGEGQTIEVAQAEASACMFPQSALDAAWNGRVHTTIGNRSVEGFVPNGVFPTRGDDEWIAVSCRSDGEWRALVAFMGSPDWASNPNLATGAGRAGQEDMIEERIGTFTANRSRADLFRELQAAGVTAGPVLNAKDVVEDPQAQQSRAFQRIPATADYFETEFPAPSYHFSRSDVRIRTSPALFGEHNDYVYRELLGMSEEQIARLREGGHIMESYAPEVIANA